jgi:hypothetical protein
VPSAAAARVATDLLAWVSVAMNTVEVALAAILWQVFHLRRNIVSMLPALWRMDRKTWT